jgi:hypothetical protein
MDAGYRCDLGLIHVRVPFECPQMSLLSKRLLLLYIILLKASKACLKDPFVIYGVVVVRANRTVRVQLLERQKSIFSIFALSRDKLLPSFSSDSFLKRRSTFSRRTSALLASRLLAQSSSMLAILFLPRNDPNIVRELNPTRRPGAL